MSKIICDICGTAYAETAKQCPICGSVRQGDAKRVTNEVKSDGNVSTGYTYVKGGRFSKSNVKKRSKGTTGNSEARKPARSDNGNGEKSNRGLVATAIVLLLAIIGIVIYIAVRFFGPISDLDPNETNGTESNQIVSCVDIVLDDAEVSFDEVGVAKLLNVTASPENTTDKVIYRSEDESIVTVTEKGKITAVAEGSTKIIITCGSVTKECVVTVQLPTETTLETIEATEDTTIPDDTVSSDEQLRLNRTDFTLSYKGDSWVLYSGDIDVSMITWTSDNESIVTFKDGKAVAVGQGSTTIHAEYNGQKVSCKVHCVFKDSGGVIGNGGVSEDGGGSASGTKTGVCYNCETSVNIRKGPGTTYGTAGSLTKGEKVTITDTKQDNQYTWYKIGEDKWVASIYIKLN